MEFISPIITPIVESLMVPVKKHIGFLVYSTKNVKEMGERMEQLKVAAQDIQETKDATVAKDQVLPKEVPKWLEDVEKMNEKAQGIPTGGIGCFNLAARYKAGKKSSDMLKMIDDLKTRKSEIKWTNEQRPLGRVRSSSTSTSAPVHDVHQIRFNSRDLIFKDALKCLAPNNETRKMALCGMGGVGKTTMMEQLKKAVEDSKMFDWVVKVVIGQNADPLVLQQAIAQYTGEDLAETAQDARADRLRHRFEGMSQAGKKKILVIMDDIWKKVDLKDVGLESPLPGLKLLFTSRSDDVCSQMGVQTDSIFKLDKLNEEEARKLFLGTVGPPVSNGNDLVRQNIGEAIAKRCGGLPIAIVVIAGSLKSKIKEAWEDALSRIEQHKLEGFDEIKTVFEISYKNLEKDEDRSVFLLSGLFPDDFDIPTEDLLRYGWGLNFFKKAKNLATARRHLMISVDNLIHANLLTKSDREGCVKMHDLIRDFVLSNFSGVKQASIVNRDDTSGCLTEDAKKSYERILLKCTGMSELPADFNYPNLSFLKLMDGSELRVFPNDFYERMSKLEVVSYEGMRTRLFPPALEHSTKLRTLCLRSCSLMHDFTFLGSLSNLETLSFAHCKIHTLPSTIGNMKKLKLLDLKGCSGLRIDDGVFQNLVSLEELYMKTWDSAIRFTDANCDELKILSQRLSALELEFFQNKAQPKNVSFRKLERFRISIGCELEGREYYSFRNTLELVADCNELLESEISELFEKTEELYLRVNDMNHLSDVSMHPSQLSFCNLRDLHVYECAELTYLFTIPVASGLKKLERLKISECPKLVSLCDMTTIELPQLVELILSDLPSITSIYPDSIYPDYDNASAMQSFLSKEVVIPKLEKLEIWGMENLKQIWPCHITTAEKNNVSMLKQIKVKECESLVNLFPSNPLPLLNHLEELQVGECGSIEVLFNIDLERVCEMEGSISRLREIEVSDSGNVRELWRMNNSSEDILLINAFKGVESIGIYDCKRFEYIFTPTTTNFDLGALTTYNVFYPPQMETDIECGEEINITSKGEISEINDSIPKDAYTSHLLHACNDKRVEAVFEMDSPNMRELPPIRDRQQPLPYLEVLQLKYLKNMSHVWKCNWNKFLTPQQPPTEFPFHNLKEIQLENCKKIKYLFSPLMAKCLSNLKEVRIERCDGMEEVVSSRDDEITTSSHTNTTTLFPHFDSLWLSGLKCLKRIDASSSRSDKVPIDITTTSIHDQFQGAQVICASWSLCQYPKEIWVEGCDTLSSLIPLYAVGQMKKLEDLTIIGCNSMIEVFESQLINNIANVDEGSECGGTGTGATLTSPGLNIITVVPQLFNLKEVSISNCDLLQHVFTFSTLESLEQLTNLTITNCKDIEVIVKDENGEQTTASKVVSFPRLEILELVNLPNLQGFFLGMNDFQWPVLNKVTINNCSKMEVFTSGPSKTQKLKYISSRLGKHILDQTCLDPNISQACSFHNLVELSMSWETLDEEEYIIPSNALEQLGKLEKINLLNCRGGKEGVFEVVALELKEGTNNINSGFNDHQSPASTVVKKIPIPNLREIYLDGSGLRYIWKSNPWMVLEFPNLTTVVIQDCKSLEHVFTCSMVGSLVHLQDLQISWCHEMKVIVKRDELEEEEECDDANVINEIIVLPRLKSLQLYNLPSLEGFCLGKEAFSLPSLDTLKIKNCPTFTVFNAGRLDTPELKVIDTNFGICHVKEDLNSLIKVKQQEGAFEYFRIL